MRGILRPDGAVSVGGQQVIIIGRIPFEVPEQQQIKRRPFSRLRRPAVDRLKRSVSSRDCLFSEMAGLLLFGVEICSVQMPRRPPAPIPDIPLDLLGLIVDQEGFCDHAVAWA
jgi:hypothetical protein